MRLSDRITQMQEKTIPHIQPQVLELLRSKTEELVRTGIADRALTVGDTIPEFILPNAIGSHISSKALLGLGPLVISFYRGGWCPYCNLELKALQEALPQILQQGGQLIAISPELPDNALSTVEKHALQFEVLSDVGNQIARQFGLVFNLAEVLRPIYQQFGFDIPKYNGDENWELPIPATYVINQEGLITRAFVDADYTRRMEPEEILAALRELRPGSRKTRAV